MLFTQSIGPYVDIRPYVDAFPASECPDMLKSLGLILTSGLVLKLFSAF